MNKEQAAIERQAAWDELFRHATLTVLEWSKLANNLDIILDDVGVKNLDSEEDN